MITSNLSEKIFTSEATTDCFQTYRVDRVLRADAVDEGPRCVGEEEVGALGVVDASTAAAQPAAPGARVLIALIVAAVDQAGHAPLSALRDQHCIATAELRAD